MIIFGLNIPLPELILIIVLFGFIFIPCLIAFWLYKFLNNKYIKENKELMEEIEKLKKKK